MSYLSGLANVSKGKKASVSSLSPEPLTVNDAGLALADDGRRDFSFHTAQEQNPWWMVDMEEEYFIHYIIIGNRRKTCLERTATLKVEVSENGTAWITVHTGLIFWKNDLVFPLAGKVSGRYVRLSLQEENYFHLTKVEIWGRTDSQKFHQPNKAAAPLHEYDPALLSDAGKGKTVRRENGCCTIDLGELCPIEGLELVKSSRAGLHKAEELKIEFSQNGRDWTLIHEGLLYWTGSLFYPLQGGGILARYCRFSPSPSSHPVSLTEKIRRLGFRKIFLDGIKNIHIFTRPRRELLELEKRAAQLEGDLRYTKRTLAWLRTPEGVPPPNLPPEHLLAQYTMGHRIPVKYYYFNGIRPVAKRVTITRARYAQVFSQIENRTFKYYGDSQLMFYDAFKKYPFAGKTVMIYGLTSCNCDALALVAGAERVFVVDYNKPTCEHEKVSCFTPEEWAKGGIQADIAISFSSFEHDGLGRYGDPLNPDGDFQAMTAAKSHVASGGLLFLGVPIGPDCCNWNAERVYGPLRLPMLLRGWECLDAYNFQSKNSASLLPETAGRNMFIQPLLVLRNGTSFPTGYSEEALRERLHYAQELETSPPPLAGND